MVKYMLHFRGKAIREGLNVVEAIGPFNTVEDAKAFHAASKAWAIPLPEADCLAISTCVEA